MTPVNTQLRKCYYSQPTPEGGQDNNKLEGFFSEFESDWPEAVEKLHRRETVDKRTLSNILGFMSLQRARVPATRDAVEVAAAQILKDTLKARHSDQDLWNHVQVSIDPHMSIHAMLEIIQGMNPLYSMLGFAAFHNVTKRPFLTSDNPVLWFDPSLPFKEQRPYSDGPVLLVFPVSPKLVIVGSSLKEHKNAFRQYGLLHEDIPSATCVNQINRQICRFAYEAVIAQSCGQEKMIARYASISPVHESIMMQSSKGMTTLHQLVFGPRTTKPKWQDRSD